MAVAVMPPLFVAITAAGRDQLIQNRGHVSLEARLELDGADGRRAANVENADNPRFNSRGIHSSGHLPGDVLHVPVTLGAEGNLLLIVHIYLRTFSTGISRAYSAPVDIKMKAWLPTL